MFYFELKNFNVKIVFFNKIKSKLIVLCKVIIKEIGLIDIYLIFKYVVR